MAAVSVMALLSTACLAAGAGVGLLDYDARKRRRQAVAAHVQTLLELRETSAAELIATPVDDGGIAAGLPWGPMWMRHAATWRWACISLAVATLVALPVVLLGWLRTGGLVWVVVAVVGGFLSWCHWQKLRAQIRQQLPSFIDNMVRMVVLGHAVQSAFLFSAASTKLPLQTTLGQASAFAKAGMPVDQALSAASRYWDLDEFFLLASIMQVGSRFGGRIDSLLERVSHFMRDREQAAQELHALSAEVRLSAWVLGLLPLVIGGMVIVTNANYFLQMWNDPTGRNLLFVALGLQACGGCLLYRLARLD